MVKFPVLGQSVQRDDQNKKAVMHSTQPLPYRHPRQGYAAAHNRNRIYHNPEISTTTNPGLPGGMGRT